MTVPTALVNLERLVGRWRMELYAASFLPEPDTRVTGSVDIAWIEDGAALRIRQGDHERTPAATWIIGRDESEDDYCVLYSDDRGVSRVYRMGLDQTGWRMWRQTRAFTQRFNGVLDSDGQRITARWEKSLDQGQSWQHDFNVDYIREPGPSAS